MYNKYEIKGEIELLTGMHIGGSTTFSAIGAVDSPVVRDPITNLPMIPGSSLKGKLRYLLSRKYNNKLVDSHDQDGERIIRLFGSAGSGKNKEIRTSRVQVSDSVLSNVDEIKELGILETEVKFENTINRATAVANPRQIERSIRGSIYPIHIVYTGEEEDEIVEDLSLLKEAFDLLEYDYLGGHGSRGYGRVKIKNLSVNLRIGKNSEKIEAEIKKIIEGE